MDADGNQRLDGHCHYGHWQAPPSCDADADDSLQARCGVDIDTDTDTFNGAVALRGLFYLRLRNLRPPHGRRWRWWWRWKIPWIVVWKWEREESV